MDECELIALISAAACGISKCCSSDDMSLLAAVFTQLGDTLATILVNRELNEKNDNDPCFSNKNSSEGESCSASKCDIDNNSSFDNISSFDSNYNSSVTNNCDIDNQRKE